MLVISLGLKLADTIRRVCMYTKADDRHKAFYALCRGCFPIPELCGTVTALGLARRDVLGQKMPLWKLLLPAAVIHGMANFRGMKVSSIQCVEECFDFNEWSDYPSTFVCSQFSNGIPLVLGWKCNCIPIF